MKLRGVTWVEGADEKVYIAEPNDDTTDVVYFMLTPPGQPVDIVANREDADRVVRVCIDVDSQSILAAKDVQEMLRLTGPQQGGRKPGMLRRFFTG